MSRQQNVNRDEHPLDPVEVSRRKVVKVALAASAVAVPVISSVALGGVSPAFAEAPNISGQTTQAGTTAAPSTEGPGGATTTVAPTTETTTTTTETPTLPPTTTTEI